MSCVTVLTDVGPVPARALVDGSWPTALTRPPRSVIVHGIEWPFYGSVATEPSSSSVCLVTHEGYKLTCEARRHVMAIRRASLAEYASAIDSAPQVPEPVEASSLEAGDVVVLNMCAPSQASWPGIVHVPGTERDAEYCFATGYALGTWRQAT